MTDGIAAALVGALGEMDELPKDKTAKVEMKSGGSYFYNYTDLGSVLGHVRPILARHGLAIMQPATCDGNVVAVTTTFLHVSGESRDMPPLTLPCGRTAQEIGSAITYARRYSLLSALGLATEDDDGKAATQATKRAPRKAAAPPAEEPPPYVDPEPETAAQRRTKHVMAMFNELGIKERPDRIAKIGAIVGREVASWADCTDDEADQVVDALRRELGR